MVNIIILSCGHHALFGSPKPNYLDLVNCSKCGNKYRSVMVGANQATYHWTCQDCHRSGKKYNTGLLHATGTHVVNWMVNGHPVERILEQTAILIAEDDLLSLEHTKREGDPT